MRLKFRRTVRHPSCSATGAVASGLTWGSRVQYDRRCLVGSFQARKGWMRREVTTHTSAGPPRVRGSLHFKSRRELRGTSEICPGRGGSFSHSLSLSFHSLHSTRSLVGAKMCCFFFPPRGVHPRLKRQVSSRGSSI
jgi:hypothetical protein